MFRLHLRYRRVSFIFIILLTFVVVIRVMFHEDDHQSRSCVVPESVRVKMRRLTEKIHESMNTLRLTHFLCYSSLWGALKMKAPLPWDRVIHFCTLNEEVSLVEEGFLIRTFKRLGLDITYMSGEGVYHVTLRGDSSCSARIVVFEQDSITHQMRRVGWKNRLLPPDSCDSLHCFPPNLIIQPLPKTTFMSIQVSIPREDFEIQKYLFPDSWWKELEPEHCKTKAH